MHSSGFNLCIKCNSGGKLLVCKGDDCPIAVHEKCMGCSASYDVAGEFDCPYCLCRKAYAELNQAKEDAKLKKRALSSFIDEKMTDCNKQNDISGNPKRKRKAPLGETENVEQSNTSKAIDSLHNIATKGGNLSGEEERVQLFEVNDVGRTVEDQVCRSGDDLVFHRDIEYNQENAIMSAPPSVQQKPSEGEKDNSKSHEESENRENNHDKTATSNENDSIFDIHLGADGGVETSNKISKEHNPLLRKSKRRKVNSPSEPPSSNVDRSGRSSPITGESPRKTKKATAPSKVNSPCEPSSSDVDYSGRSSPVIRKSSRKAKKTNIPSEARQPEGRRKFFWTEEEEEMIKKGVEKFTSKDNKKIPWRNILKFGQHVFHSSRMPDHLKDKWRKMLAKENLAK